MTTFETDPRNAVQAAAWDGDEGAYWAHHAERFDRAVACYHERFFDAAAIGLGDRVLDIGCGTGQTTRDAAVRAADGSALGIDLSAQMVDVARRLAAQHNVGNVTFEQADAQIYPFAPGAFEVAISRTGTMFFGDAHAAFANIARAMRPGGKLVMLVWQGPEPNEWIRALSQALAAGRELPSPPVGASGPFAFADPQRTRGVLTAVGFSDIELHPAAGPMWFGTGADDAFAFVLGLLGWMLEGLDDAGCARARDDLYATVSAHAGADGVTFDSAAWLVEAVRA